MSLSMDTFNHSPRIHWALDGDGHLLLQVRDEADRVLAQAPSLFRLGSGEAPCFSQLPGPPNAGEAISADGRLACRAAEIGLGRYGETCYEVELRNIGPDEVDGAIRLPFTEWADTPAQAQAASGQHLAIEGARVTVGGIGTLDSHTPGISLGAFVTAPLSDRRGQVSVQAHASRPSPRLPPDESITYRLHVHAGPGDRHEAMRVNFRQRGAYAWDPAAYSLAQYENPSLRWMRDIVVVWFNWPWDKTVVDPCTGEYRLAQSVAEARRQIGGYDVYVIWPFWPRAGFDDRFQFDHYRDFPGGLDGLRDEVRKVQALGTRVIAAYCYWSESDQAPPDQWPVRQHASFADLVEVATAIEVDGVLMDIFSTTPEEILSLSRARGRELAPYNEGDPDYWASQTNLLGRIHNETAMPPLNLKRYLLPHHPLLRVCESGREHRHNRKNFTLSFFNGHGVEMATVWPETQPQFASELELLKRMVDLLRTHRNCFRSPGWDMLIDSLDPRVWINRWPAGDKTVYTLCGTDSGGHRGDLLRLPHDPDVHYVDLWRCRPILPRVTTDGDGAWDILACQVEGYTPGQGQPMASGDYSPGCIGAFRKRITARLSLERLSIDVAGAAAGQRLEIWRDVVRPEAEPVRLPAAERVEVNLHDHFGHTNDAIVIRLLDGDDQVIDMAVLPPELLRFFRIETPARTAPADPRVPPEGMVRIPGGAFACSVAQSQPVWMATYLTADDATSHYAPAPPSTPVELAIAPFWIDRYPVTNAQFAEFVTATGYLGAPGTSPVARQNFLKHFVAGRPPAGHENHPVVYVSHEDASAYARWAGKRLPSEVEWQYAAGAADGRAYPWGNELDAACYNAGRVGTLPVDAHPRGASPYGVQDLVGNIWQWTAELMDNGRHILAFLRGGGWYDMPNGRWWVRGGPRRIDDHHPLPLFGPGMNRLSTVGFRCVKDEG